MYQVKCIEKIRDKNNHIIEYKLIGNNKNVKSIKSNELKEAIRSGQLEVVNLTLTSDNRLIDKKSDTPSKHVVTPSKPNVNIKSLLNRVKTIGYTINTFNTKCKHKCYIASSTDHLKHMFIIPADVKYIYRISDKEICKNALYEYMSDIEGMLKVIGGKNLISTQRLFMDCGAKYIDLSSFDTSNVTDMHNMFDCCEAQSINLTSFNTSKVTNMHEMFRECKAQSLDLSSFDTSNVTDMHSMFYNCKAQSIALSSFKTSNVTDMSHMFYKCKVQSLDLRSFNTSNVTDMQSMFSCCITQSLDLTSFDTSNVVNMNTMFHYCEAHSIDLTSFDTSNVTEMGWMFSECKVHSLDLSSFNTSEVTDIRGLFLECKAQIKVNDPRLKAKLQIDNG